MSITQRYMKFSRELHRIKWIWLSIGVFCAPTTAKDPVVETPLGTYHGYYKVSMNGRKYEAFEGIPYAQPPTGSLRFEDPVPITNSFGQLNATKKSEVCVQYHERTPFDNEQPAPENSIWGSEDCLYLNVYVPLLQNSTKLMPAIVHIHGGGFQYGASGFLGDRYLADRDIIYITINYRLGLLGFLSTEDETVPGNMGLKDQNLALKWISQYIQYFRGDSSRITLLGFSAGSSSVQYHHLSPLSRGLFSNSIGISGTVFNPWAYAKGARQKTEQLATLLQCPMDNTSILIECIRKLPARDVVRASKHFQTWQNNPEAPWAPVVEKHGSKPFISKSPREIFQSGSIYDVPAIFGVTKDEGSDPISGYAPHDHLLKQLDENWISIAPGLLGYNYTIPSSMYDQVAIDSRREYFGNETINKKTVNQLRQLLTDRRYFTGIENGVRLQAAASKNPVRMYLYSFRGSASRSDLLSRTHNDYGVCHGDDLNLVTERRIKDEALKTQEEHEMTNFILDMWTSMAYHSEPRLSVDWEPVNASDPEFKYLAIASPGNYSMAGSRDFGRKSFWRKFFFTV